MSPDPVGLALRLIDDVRNASAERVLDIRMTARAWSLEPARDYRRENSFFPETEIRSETLRYACDVAGQAFAYRLGEFAIADRRARMRDRLGDKFNLRDFHEAVHGVS